MIFQPQPGLYAAYGQDSFLQYFFNITRDEVSLIPRALCLDPLEATNSPSHQKNKDNLQKLTTVYAVIEDEEMLSL